MFETSGSPFRYTRRGFCRLASLSALGWASARALNLAESCGAAETGAKAKSLILLWLNGGPSQLETFDPHPGGEFGGPTKAIDAAQPGVQIAEGLPRVAEEMTSIALIRSMVGKEGDHDRARYLMKTGYRPNPSVAHPSIGAVLASELPIAGAEIPRYVTILSNDRFARGGYLGEAHDPFRIWDPQHPPGNIQRTVSNERFDHRLAGMNVIESALARRNKNLEARTLHRHQMERALAMMDSEQLKAFDIGEETVQTRRMYGDTAFGRGCLAARRLVEVGVRCVEVQLAGWDTHADNFEGHKVQNEQLDPALAGLVKDLRDRDMLDSTLVVCVGEFGRTPRINPLDGRDHWAKGFSAALAGGGVQGGRVVGATDPLAKKDPQDPVNVEDLFATILTALGVDPRKEIVTPIGRPIKFSEGKPVLQLFDA